MIKKLGAQLQKAAYSRNDDLFKALIDIGADPTVSPLIHPVLSAVALKIMGWSLLYNELAERKIDFTMTDESGTAIENIRSVNNDALPNFNNRLSKSLLEIDFSDKQVSRGLINLTLSKDNDRTREYIELAGNRLINIGDTEINRSLLCFKEFPGIKKLMLLGANPFKFNARGGFSADVWDQIIAFDRDILNETMIIQDNRFLWAADDSSSASLDTSTIRKLLTIDGVELAPSGLARLLSTTHDSESINLINKMLMKVDYSSGDISHGQLENIRRTSGVSKKVIELISPENFAIGYEINRKSLSGSKQYSPKKTDARREISAYRLNDIRKSGEYPGPVENPAERENIYHCAQRLAISADWEVAERNGIHAIASKYQMIAGDLSSIFKIHGEKTLKLYVDIISEKENIGEIDSICSNLINKYTTEYNDLSPLEKDVLMADIIERLASIGGKVKQPHALVNLRSKGTTSQAFITALKHSDSKSLSIGIRSLLRSSSDNPEAVQLMINAGAHPLKETFIEGHQENSRIKEDSIALLAFRVNCFESAKILSAYGFDNKEREALIEQAVKYGKKFVDLLEDNGVNVKPKDVDSAIKQLKLSRGLSPGSNIASFMFKNRLEFVQRYLSLSTMNSRSIINEHLGSKELIDDLIDKGIVDLKEVDSCARTVLFQPGYELRKAMSTEMVVNQMDDFICEAIKQGVDVNATDNKGMTALMHACLTPATVLKSQKTKQSPFIAPLIKAGADVTIQDLKGNTALHYVAMLREPIVVEISGLLVAAGTLSDVRNKDGKTALDIISETDLELSELESQQLYKNFALSFIHCAQSGDDCPSL